MRQDLERAVLEFLYELASYAPIPEDGRTVILFARHIIPTDAAARDLLESFATHAAELLARGRAD